MSCTADYNFYYLENDDSKQTESMTISVKDGSIFFIIMGNILQDLYHLQ